MNRRFRALASFLTLVGVLFSGCLSAEDLDRGDELAHAADPQNATIDPEVFSGRLVCGVGVHRTTLNPCAAVGLGNKNVFKFEVQKDLQTLVLGLRWDATTELGERLQLLVETKDYGLFDHGEGHRYAAPTGSSVLVVRIDDDPEHHGDWAWSNLTGHQAMQARVFAPTQTPPSVVLDQAFDLVVVSYYGAPAPVDVDPFAVVDAMSDDASDS